MPVSRYCTPRFQPNNCLGAVHQQAHTSSLVSSAAEVPKRPPQHHPQNAIAKWFDKLRHLDCLEGGARDGEAGESAQALPAMRAHVQSSGAKTTTASTV